MDNLHVLLRQTTIAKTFHFTRAFNTLQMLEGMPQQIS